MDVKELSPENKLAALKMLDAYRNATSAQIHDTGADLRHKKGNAAQLDNLSRNLQNQLDKINGHIKTFNRASVNYTAAEDAAKTIGSLNEGIHLRVAGLEGLYNIDENIEKLPTPMKDTAGSAIHSAERAWKRLSPSQIPEPIGREPRRR